MYKISYITDKYDTTIKHKTIKDLSEIVTSKNKNDSPLWYFSTLKDRKTQPSFISGFVVDWDNKQKPQTSKTHLHFIHQTHSDNWRIIVPFDRAYRFTNASDYKNSYMDMLSQTLSPETLDIKDLIKKKFIDKGAISSTRAFFMRPTHHSIQKIGEDLYTPSFKSKPIKQIKNEVVEFGERQEITDLETGKNILQRMQSFYDYYKCTLNWEFVKPEEKRCIFAWHDNETNGDIAFNNPSPNYLANIRCYHETCRQHLAEACAIYQPLEADKKKTKLITNPTVQYLAMGIIQGIYTIEQVEACGFYEHKRMLNNLMQMRSLKFNPKMDVPLWLRILHKNILMDSKTKKIYEYDGSYYKETDEDVLKAYYHSTAGTYVGYRTDIKTKPYIEDMVEYSKGVLLENFNQTYYTDGLSLDNGIIKLNEDGSYEFLPHDPNYFFSHKLTYSYCQDKTPKLWLKCLEDYFGEDSEQAKLLQEYFGYCLTDTRSFEKLLILYGKSRGGKNTIIETIMHMLPSEAYNLHLICNPKEREAIIDKKMVFINEAVVSNTENTMNELKKLSSTDPIMVRPLFKPAYTVTKIPKLIMSFNNAPENLKIDRALKNRMLSIKFVRSFEGREDIHLKDKLLKERPAILNWALEGYKRLIENGGFTNYNRDSDALYRLTNEGDFVIEEFITNKIQDGVKEELLSKLHLDFIEMSELEMNLSDFSKKLSFMGYTKKRSSKGMKFILTERREE